jgi:hypothetical protein
LQKFIDRAQILRDELAYMLESGDTLAGNLADRIQVTRQTSQKAAKDTTRDADTGGLLTDAEKLAAQIVAATDDAMPETEKSREKTIMKALRGLR